MSHKAHHLVEWRCSVAWSITSIQLIPFRTIRISRLFLLMIRIIHNAKDWCTEYYQKHDHCTECVELCTGYIFNTPNVKRLCWEHYPNEKLLWDKIRSWFIVFGWRKMILYVPWMLLPLQSILHNIVKLNLYLNTFCCSKFIVLIERFRWRINDCLGVFWWEYQSIDIYTVDLIFNWISTI